MNKKIMIFVIGFALLCMLASQFLFTKKVRHEQATPQATIEETSQAPAEASAYKKGICYKMIPDDPFGDPIVIRVLDMKKGYVQYEYLPGSGTPWSCSESSLRNFFEVDCSEGEE
jgi:hypothetical protein